jgi:hypothetical protein
MHRSKSRSYSINSSASASSVGGSLCWAASETIKIARRCCGRSLGNQSCTCLWVRSRKLRARKTRPLFTQDQALCARLVIVRRYDQDRFWGAGEESHLAFVRLLSGETGYCQMVVSIAVRLLSVRVLSTRNATQRNNLRSVRLALMPYR